MSGRVIAELLPSISGPKSKFDDGKFENDREMDIVQSRWLLPVEKTDNGWEKKSLFHLMANTSILAGNCTGKTLSWKAVKLNVTGTITNINN
jgi:hypothetical protein